MNGTTVSENTGSNNSAVDAEFIGWQENSFGAKFALYNIIHVGHPLFGSTVTEETLRTMKLRVPETFHP